MALAMQCPLQLERAANNLLIGIYPSHNYLGVVRKFYRIHMFLLEHNYEMEIGNGALF